MRSAPTRTLNSSCFRHQPGRGSEKLSCELKFSDSAAAAIIPQRLPSHRVPAHFFRRGARLSDPLSVARSGVVPCALALHAPEEWTGAAGVTDKNDGIARTSLPDASPSRNRKCSVAEISEILLQTVMSHHTLWVKAASHNQFPVTNSRPHLSLESWRRTAR